METAVWYLMQASEMVGFLAFAGFLLALNRMRTTPNRQIMAGFALVMLGCAMREVVVYYAGAVVWDKNAVMASAVARYIWVMGAILFVRAITHERCSEWAWIGLIITAASFAAVV